MNKEIAYAIANYEDADGVDYFEEITTAKPISHSRWIKRMEQVYQDRRDKSYWIVRWDDGNTEMQEVCPDERNIEFFEAVPETVYVVRYVKK
jgi:hypothetical protein